MFTVYHLEHAEEKGTHLVLLITSKEKKAQQRETVLFLHQLIQMKLSAPHGFLIYTT